MAQQNNFKAGDRVRARGTSVLLNIFCKHSTFTLLENPYYPAHSEYPLIIRLEGWPDPFHFTASGHYLPPKAGDFPDLVRVE